jgi:pyruvate dehydrogenase E2 component (dihydrolipoamide acetyltransferase)
MANEVKLQALKENVDVVEVNEVLASVGDDVAVDQPLLEVQADKASLPVPSPVAGRVVEMRVKPGDEIPIGHVYCVIEGADGQQPPRGEQEPKGVEAMKQVEEARDTKPKTEDIKAAIKEEKPAPPPARVPPARVDRDRKKEPARPAVVHAGPATRRLARELGVPLEEVTGSGKLGRITEDDIRGHVRRLATGGGPVSQPSGEPSLPDFTKWGEVERQPLRGVRKATARQMGLAWRLIPHVTQHDLADVTELEAFRKEQSAQGVKLTITAFALKAAAVALGRFPRFNASLDGAKNELVLKRYCHIGVAVDTEQGLLVPVVRNVREKSVMELAGELVDLAARAREGKLDADAMAGATFTISNLGGIGGTAFTPIVNWPEVAILGMSRGRWEPRLADGQFTQRMMLPLSLSYDHRVIDGAEAARFTRFLAELLEKPALLLLLA